MNERKNGRTNGWIDRWRDGGTNELTEGGLLVLSCAHLCEWISYGWHGMNGRADL